MLTAGGVTAMHVGSEHRSVDTQLTGERGHDLWVGLLADAQHPTGKPGITELDGEAELGRGAPMTATDQLELGVGQSVEARQGAVVERSGEAGELGALGRDTPSTAAFDLVRQLRNTAARQRSERAAILGM